MLRRCEQLIRRHQRLTPELGRTETPLADAKVSLLHVYGDADDVVPWEENTGVIAERYKKLGGDITLIGKKGVGHHPHGLADSTPIVDFILKHAAGK